MTNNSVDYRSRWMTAIAANDEREKRTLTAEAENVRLRAVVAKHHAQKADDRCQFDDDELYAAFGLPPVDRRVGDKAAMLENCKRFIDRRCEAGGWPTYAELEAERDKLAVELSALRATVEKLREAAMAVKRGAYLDDNVLNRHGATTVKCEPLRQLFSAAMAAGGEGKNAT